MTPPEMMAEIAAATSKAGAASIAEFQPDWRLDPPDALAVVLRIALHRHGVTCESLETDEQWRDLCQEIIAMMADGISPMRLLEMPRAWDEPQK